VSFARPFLLLLLVAPVLLCAWEWQPRGHPLVLPFDHSGARGSSWLRRIVSTAQLLPHLLLAVAIVILAGPRRLGTPQAERVLTNIQLVLDVSGSMTARFGDGSRYDAAMDAIKRFTTYRTGDAFGLTIFGTEVLHWVPLTKDLSAIRLATPFLRPEKMPPFFGGTMIGKALRDCKNILASRHEGDRMIILISDGMSADLGGAVDQEIASELRAENIAVYTIHVADTPAPESMFTIAGHTGGKVFEAAAPRALEEVFQRIDAMQPVKLKPGANAYADFLWPVALVGMVLCGLHLGAAFGLRYTPW
jgi:Ca-activated chloride channel family protein